MPRRDHFPTGQVMTGGLCASRRLAGHCTELHTGGDDQRRGMARLRSGPSDSGVGTVLLWDLIQFGTECSHVSHLQGGP